jgi:hypothetical protein
MQVSTKEKGCMLLISKDRSKRVVLAPNGDILIVLREAKRGSSVLETKIKESLVHSYCA